MLQDPAERGNLLVWIEKAAGIGIVVRGTFGRKLDPAFANRLFIAGPYDVQCMVAKKLRNHDVAVSRPITALVRLSLRDLSGCKFGLDRLKSVGLIEPWIRPRVRKMLGPKGG